MRVDDNYDDDGDDDDECDENDEDYGDEDGDMITMMRRGGEVR